MRKLKNSSTFIKGFVSSVYSLMGVGVLVSAIAAWLVSGMPEVKSFLSQGWVFLSLFAMQIAIVFTIAGLTRQIGSLFSGVLFLLFSAIIGMLGNTIVDQYTGASIATTFLVATGMFFSLSLYGLTTKKDLSSWGKALFLALVGLILVGIANIFLQNSALEVIISCIGVLIFAGFTAYDSQQVLVAAENADPSRQWESAIPCSLALYLNFINLFMNLLSIFGEKD